MSDKIIIIKNPSKKLLDLVRSLQKKHSEFNLKANDKARKDI